MCTRQFSSMLYLAASGPLCDRADTAKQSITDGWVSLKQGGVGGESIIIECPGYHLL